MRYITVELSVALADGADPERAAERIFDHACDNQYITQTGVELVDHIDGYEWKLRES